MRAQFVIPVLASILILGVISSNVDVLGAAVKTVEELCSKGGGPRLVLCAAIGTLTADNEQLTADNTSLTIQISNLQSQITALENEKSALEVDNAALIQQVADLQNQINPLNSQITNLQNQITSLNDQINSLNSQISSLNQQISDLTESGIFRTVLDSSGAGIQTSIAIGTDNNPIISYVASGRLKVVHCTNATCSSFNSPTLIQFSRSGHTSIAIGTDGNPVISYYDFTSRDLHFVHCKNVSCSSFDTPIKLDTTGNVGQNTSIAIGTDGNPVISYRDLSNGHVKVLHCTNITCTDPFSITSVDTGAGGGGLGAETSLAIGSDNNPVVAYMMRPDQDLRVVHCLNVSCTSADSPITIESSGPVGLFPSVAIGADGNPIVSYHDNNSGGGLKVVHCTVVNCSSFDISTLISSSSSALGWYTSIAIDNNNKPVISAQDPANDDLLLFHCEDEECTIFDALIKDIPGDVGSNTDVVIGSNGVPIVSYSDITNQDLVVINMGPFSFL